MTATGDRDGRRSSAASGVVDGLTLAAAPTFAAMALIQAASRSDSMSQMCMTGARASPLAGMAAMYVLMSLFHLPPWLKLAFGRC